MDAGTYRKRIVIEQCEGYTTDDVGNQIIQYVEFFACYAYANAISGTEYWQASQVQAENTVTMTTRWHEKLKSINTKDFRIRMDGIVYNIESIDNVMFKNETVKFRCSRLS